MKYVIAIVEDVQEEAAQLENHFKKYELTTSDTFELRRFYDGAEFINHYQPIYDLVMMDINLPRCNGMEAAAKLREIDPSVALIFVTSMVQYAVRGYEVEATDFLVKPVSYQNFVLKMQRTLRRLQARGGNELLVPLQDGLCRIFTNHIKYIEVTNHSLIYHTTEGKILSRGKMSELEIKLSNQAFIRCNRCYLVNLAFVKSVRGFNIIVDNDTLQISRPKRQAVLDALNNYLGGGV